MYFRTVLDLQQNWAEGEESSHIIYVPSYPQPHPLVKSQTRVGFFVTISEPNWNIKLCKDYSLH